MAQMEAMGPFPTEGEDADQKSKLTFCQIAAKQQGAAGLEPMPCTFEISSLTIFPIRLSGTRHSIGWHLISPSSHVVGTGHVKQDREDWRGRHGAVERHRCGLPKTLALASRWRASWGRLHRVLSIAESLSYKTEQHGKGLAYWLAAPQTHYLSWQPPCTIPSCNGAHSPHSIEQSSVRRMQQQLLFSGSCVCL